MALLFVLRLCRPYKCCSFVELYGADEYYFCARLYISIVCFYGCADPKSGVHLLSCMVLTSTVRVEGLWLYYCFTVVQTLQVLFVC